MFFALVNDVPRQAAPKLSGNCPLCRERVIPKCGEIVIWHWAHKSGVECDHWSEPMTEWHRDWQNKFPKSMREKVITLTEEIGPDDPRYDPAKNTVSDAQSISESHRADVMLPEGTIIEFQHSTISTTDIASREKFYGGQLIWVFDTTDAVTNERLEIWTPEPSSNNEVRPTERSRRFRWYYPRKSIAHCQATIYLDLGENRLLKVTDMSKNASAGWGIILSHDEFVRQVGVDENHWEPNPDFIAPRGRDEYMQIYSTLTDLPKCAECHRPCTVPHVQHREDGTPCHLSCLVN